jgi:hypothetical protein
MDDPDSFESPPAAAPWRVPAYVVVPVVLVCALLGYAISLMMPLHPAPANPARLRPAPIAKTGTLETLPANPVESPRIAVHRPITTDLPRDPDQTERTESESPKLPPTPAVETSSVDPLPQPAPETVAEQKIVPNTAKTNDVSRPETQARRAPRRFRRVVYWRPRPKPPAGPVEAFFSALTK